MSQVRKIQDEKIKLKLKKMTDIFEFGLSSILSTVNVERVDIVYDSYLDSSIKECERMRRRSKCQPLEFIGFTEDNPIPAQLDRFWACSKNKENLQILSRAFFKDYSRDKSMQMFLSGYVTDSNNLHSSEVCVNVLSELYPELNSYIGEADGRIIPHVTDAIMGFNELLYIQMTLMWLFTGSITHMIFSNWELQKFGFNTELAKESFPFLFMSWPGLLVKENQEWF